MDTLRSTVGAIGTGMLPAAGLSRETHSTVVDKDTQYQAEGLSRGSLP